MKIQDNTQNFKTLKRATQKTKKDFNFAVFDVETWGLRPKPSHLAFGVLRYKEQNFYFENQKEFEQIVINNLPNKTYIFAHNAEFDISAVFGNIYQTVDNAAVFNNKFIFSKFFFNDNEYTFADSYNLFPTSLDNIGKMLGYPKGTTPEKFKTGSINEGINNDDINYCIRDCEITQKALQDFFTSTGKISLTIGSASMHAFRKKYLKYDIKFNQDLTDLFFLSYFGGRTEVFKMGQCNAKVYDINSLYPYVMKKSFFPDPTSLKIKNKPKKAAYLY